MPTRATPSAPATEAIDEAVRTFSAASQNGAAYAQQALSTTRAYLSDVLALNPTVLEGWQTDVQTLFTAGFGLQNALLEAMPPVLDARVAAARSIFDAYTAMVQQQQGVVLGAWKRTIATTQHFAPPAT